MQGYSSHIVLAYLHSEMFFQVERKPGDFLHMSLVVYLSVQEVSSSSIQKKKKKLKLSLKDS